MNLHDDLYVVDKFKMSPANASTRRITRHPACGHRGPQTGLRKRRDVLGVWSTTRNVKQAQIANSG